MSKHYFISDLHLGAAYITHPRAHEQRVTQFLDAVKRDAASLWLLGDVLDYWFEYRNVVPRGHVRFFGKLAELADSGIEIHWFTGNHDVWMFDYLPSELGIELHSEPLLLDLNGKRFMLHHGDGLGPGDRGYRLMKRCFRSRTLQWMFAHLLHPDLSQWIGHTWSRRSRASKPLTHPFGGETERITQFARQTLEHQHIDYFIFGHWHSPAVYPLNSTSTLVVLGDWLENYTYAQWDGQQLELLRFGL